MASLTEGALKVGIERSHVVCTGQGQAVQPDRCGREAAGDGGRDHGTPAKPPGLGPLHPVPHRLTVGETTLCTHGPSQEGSTAPV